MVIVSVVSRGSGEGDGAGGSGDGNLLLVLLNWIKTNKKCVRFWQLLSVLFCCHSKG